MKELRGMMTKQYKSTRAHKRHQQKAHQLLQVAWAPCGKMEEYEPLTQQLRQRGHHLAVVVRHVASW